MTMSARHLTLALSFGFLAAVGCGGDPEVTGGPGLVGAAGGSSGAGATSGGSVNIGGGGTGGGAATGGTNGSGCGGVVCGVGQRCETADDGSQSCVDNACGDLTCSATEECQPAPGGGFYCADISCSGDVDCPINRFCDGEICVDDACVGGSQTCDGDQVLVCSSNGGGTDAAYSCGSAGYYTSSCDDSNPEAAGCTCEDDWDCPEFTACEAGTCVGTGKEPTCTLPVAPFADLLPEREFHWGGTSNTSQDATGKPFPWSAQVASTPMVINLDDDNGDGKADERDFPEIVFITYHGGDPSVYGVVRAVHGGGPTKGQDYFALCADTHWFEGDAQALDCVPSDAGDSRGAANLHGAEAAAAGDIDADGFPEIVVATSAGGFEILNNRGEILVKSADALWPTTTQWRYPAPAIANIDFQGLAEVVIGNRVITLKKTGTDLEIDKIFTGEKSTGTQDHDGTEEFHHGPMVCLADLTADPGLEIVAATTAYRLPDVKDCGSEPTSDYCTNKLSVVWDAYTIDSGGGGTAQMDVDHSEGFCAVADVLGSDRSSAPGPGNELDGSPEVVVVSEGYLVVLGGDDGKLYRYTDLNGAGTDKAGGAPNIDDFDGDGYPEIATALEAFYDVIDLQDPEPTNCPAWTVVMGKNNAPPAGNTARTPGASCTQSSDCNTGAVCNTQIGQCVCLHNGWMRTTEDDSSRVTSSSVFDFNGDGAAEVVYNDECYFRIYDGASGGVYLQIPSVSRTIIENPVVADVDNDGNAEIIFANNNETLQCSEDPLDSWDPADTDLTDNNDVDRESLPNGIDVWGDPSDRWVAARRIWNQNSYHVTNVTEGGSIPSHEPESWKPLNGRLYNTYRSQPRNYNVAPDLALTGIQISSPDVACGELSDTIQIVVEVRNQGDLRVGPGVVLDFSGIWEGPPLSEALEDENGDPITVTLDKSLEPGASTLITVTYDKGNNGRDDFPTTVDVTIDGADAERECNEDNNAISGDLDAGAQVADLRLEVDDANGCSPPEIDVTVYNDGSADAADVLVYIYGGDPSQGGALLGQTTIAGPIAPGDSASVTVTLDALQLDVTIWGVADPMNAIAECNDANNVDEGPFLDCDSDIR